MADDDPPNIIPFGKHKGKTVEEVQLVEPSYLDWLIGQPWFRDRHVILYQTVINRGGEPEETPEHNALQVLFLDNGFCLRFIYALGFNPTRVFERRRNERISELEDKHRAVVKTISELGRTTYGQFKPEEYLEYIEREKRERFEPSVEGRAFEAQGWDVVFEAPYAGRFAIEIKPSVGDDYPAILRQINTLRHRSYGVPVLFLERYVGVGATREQFIAIFKQAGIAVVFRDQVDAPR